MISKKIEPIRTENRVVGTIIQYRLFGILLYKKSLFYPDNFDASRDFIPNF